MGSSSSGDCVSLSEAAIASWTSGSTCSITSVMSTLLDSCASSLSRSNSIVSDDV